MTTETLLSFNNVSKSFGTLLALSRVSFSLTKGEVLSLYGPNGAGKSTLLRCAAGLIEPDVGKIELSASTGSGAVPRVGVVFQSTMLYADLSIAENLEFIAKIYGVLQTKEAVRAILAQFKLEEFANRKVRNCSQGVQRRASIARAMLGEPKLLLLDEPFLALDAAARDQLSQELANIIEQGAGVLIATHDRAVIAELSQRVLLFERGKLIDDCSPTVFLGS